MFESGVLFVRVCALRWLLYTVIYACRAREGCEVFDIYTSYSPVRLVSALQRPKWKQRLYSITPDAIAANIPFRIWYETKCSRKEDRVSKKVQSHMQLLRASWECLTFSDLMCLFFVFFMYMLPLCEKKCH